MPDGAPTWGYEVLELPVETELPNIKSFIDRTSALALLAGKRALGDAGLLERDRRPANVDIGCAYGSMLGCLEGMGIFWNKVKSTNPKFAQPLTFTQGYANSPSSLQCIEFGLKGVAATFAGERLAGMEALVFAYDQIAAGSAQAVLVSASESLTPASYNHFFSTGQLSPSGAWREGLIPGEGGVSLMLEEAEQARARGARILAEVARVELLPLGEIRREAAAWVFTPPWLEPGGSARGVSIEQWCGDMLAASPLAAALVGAGVLSGRVSASALGVIAGERIEILSGTDAGPAGRLTLKKV